MPGFLHDFGDEFHHSSLMRTCPRDEDADYDFKNWRNPPRKWRFEFHELIEGWLLYPLRKFITIDDGRNIKILDIPLSFIWGLVCGFPLKDVILYTVWFARGCKAIQVWKQTEKGYEIW
jgi:hypothetical protein